MNLRLVIPILCLSATCAYSQREVMLDTLTAGIIRLSKTGGGTMWGFTSDMSVLNISSYPLAQAQSFSLPADSADHLVIVRDGSIEVLDKKLGPGGVALLTADDSPAIHQTGATRASFFLISLRSRSINDPKHIKVRHFTLLTDWQDMPVKKTEKGESRQIFSCPMSSLSKIDMHATTLDAGEISHPVHVHRNAEIIVLRSGHVRMHIGNLNPDAAGGDVIYIPPGVPHNLENSKDAPCEYFALQWEP